MSTRAALVGRLLAVPTAELLELLDDDAIIDLAARYFQRLAETPTEDVGSLAAIETAADIASSDVTAVQSAADAVSSDPFKDKARRPLNGFMAFRSYYLKIFSGYTQKSASGFLTMLWHKDPVRNRWALIAKVYSFIRDEVGKDKIPLSRFLGICCPIMKIIKPSNYLSSLGWHVQNNNEGSQQLLRHDDSARLDTVALQTQDHPTTELDLLYAILDIGILPTHSLELMQRLSGHNNGRMISDANRRHVPCTIEKLDFLCTAQEDPMKAAKVLFGNHYDEVVMRDSGYQIHEVHDLGDIGHLPLEPPTKAYSMYQSTFTHHGLDQPIFNLEAVPEHDCYDVGNPYDMDAILGFPEYVQEGSVDMAGTPPFDAQEDFQLLF